MNVELRPATALEVAAFYGTTPTIQTGLFVDGVCIAMGAVARVNGAPWAILRVSGDVSGYGMRIVRALRAGLDGIEEPVRTLCHVDLYPEAPRLLRLLGFVPTQETYDDRTVWIR